MKVINKDSTGKIIDIRDIARLINTSSECRKIISRAIKTVNGAEYGER